MPAMLGLPDALRRRGLKVEVVPGWETRSAGSFNPKGAVAHWTAGPARSTTRPSLNVVINGRPGLDGPLCNVYGARDGTAVVVAAGRANHAGAGGWRGLVGNSAVFGTEMEGADASDFTQAQRWAYPRIHAAYCDLGGFSPEMNCGHSEWAGPRKVDINGYTPDILRRDIAAVLAGGSTTTAAKGSWMTEPISLDNLKKIREFVWRDALPDGLVPIAMLSDVQHAVRDGIHSTVPGSNVVLAPRDMLASVDNNAYTTAQQIAGLSAAVNALSGLLASQQSLSADDIKSKVTEALEGINVKLDVQ